MNQTKPTPEELFPDSPFLRYHTKGDQADKHRYTIYWHLRAVFYMFFILAPSTIKTEIYKQANWGYGLLTGSLPEIETPCSMKNCQRNSIAYLPNDKSYSDGNPACRRHYIIVKAMIYTLITTLFGLIILPVIILL